jgi:hypothetical protein
MMSEKFTVDSTDLRPSIIMVTYKASRDIRQKRSSVILIGFVFEASGVSP